MAHRSQCSSAGDNPLDPNYLPPHYREEYRLAIDALIEADLEGYYGFLQDANVVDFLSRPEIEYIKCTVQVPSQHTQTDRRYVVGGDGDGSSDTYWPIHSDLDAPGLDLGWPQQHRFVGPTEITTLVNPPDPEMPSIKEQVRRMIKNAQQVVAVAMDMFTDVDIFADILNAAMRNVAVYVLLDELNAHHFVAMVNNCRVNLDEIKFLRVRTVSGSTYYCHTGKSFKGQMMNRFLLVDCKIVLSGHYSFMWSFEKIHRCIAHVFVGQFVATFDEEFRILFAQSEPLVMENAVPYVEVYGNFPQRNTFENPNMFMKEHLPIENIRAEWPGRSFEDPMKVQHNLFSLRRGESVHSSTDEHLPLAAHAPQQFRGEHPFLDQRRVMQGPNNDMGRFRRQGYPGYRGEQNTEDFEMQGAHFPREQYFSQRAGPEQGYEIYRKPRDYSYPQLDQYPGSEFPHEMDDVEPPGGYDHVQRFLHSYPPVEKVPAENLLVPVQSPPRRHSMGQSFPCQTSPTQPNLPEQKHFFNVHHKRQDQKEGLRDWRISSYLTALQHSGPEDMEDLQRSDSFDSASYDMHKSLGRPCESEIPEPRQEHSEFIKAPTRKLNVQPLDNLSLPEKSLDLQASLRSFLASNAKQTPTTTSESSGNTEGDKPEEPKESNLTREESFRRRPNLAIQRSSRLRHSLIFSSNLELPTTEDAKSSLSQSSEDDPLKKSAVISNILEKKKSATKEPFQWSTLVKPPCDPTLDSATKTESEDISGKTKEESAVEKGETNEMAQKYSQMEKGLSLDLQVTENTQIQPKPSVLQRSNTFMDMNDPDCRLRFFKELAAKRKAELAQANVSSKGKVSKEPEKSKKSLPDDKKEEKKPTLDIPTIPPVAEASLQKCPVGTSQESNTKALVSQVLTDKNLKHKSHDFKMTEEHSSPKSDSSCRAISTSATDAEKIKLKQQLFEEHDPSPNTDDDNSASVVKPELQLGLHTRPKLLSQLRSIPNISSSEFSRNKFSYPSVLRPKHTKLSPTDPTALQTVPCASMSGPSQHPTASETGVIQHSTSAEAGKAKRTDTTQQDPAAVTSPSQQTPAVKIDPSQRSPAAEIVTSQQIPAAETGPSKQIPASETGPSKQNPAPETDPSKQIPAPETDPSKQTPASETGPSKQIPAAETGPSKQIPAPETDPSKQIPASETGPSKQIPAAETGPSKQFSASETGPSKQFSASETGPSKQIPASDTGPSKQIPASDTGPSKQIPASETGPSKQMPASETGPFKQIPASETGPSKQIPVSETGPSKQIPAPETGLSKQIPASETGPSKQISAPETGPSKQISAPETGPSKQISAPETGPSKQISAPETGPSKQIAASETGPSKHITAAKTSPSKQFIAAETGSSQQIPTAKIDLSDQIPTAVIDASQQIPAAETSTSEKIPAISADPSKQIPAAESDPSRPIPAKETDGSQKIPAAKTDLSKQIPAAETDASQQILAAEMDASQQIPATEMDASQQIAATEVDASQQIPAAEVGASQQIPAAEEDASQQIPAAEVDASQQIPAAEEDASQQIPAAEVDASQQIPAAEVDASKQIPAAEVGASQQIPAAKIEASKQIPAAETSPSQQTPVAETTPSSKTPAAETGLLTINIKKELDTTNTPPTTASSEDLSAKQHSVNTASATACPPQTSSGVSLVPTEESDPATSSLEADKRSEHTACDLTLSPLNTPSSDVNLPDSSMPLEGDLCGNATAITVASSVQTDATALTSSATDIAKTNVSLTNTSSLMKDAEPDVSTDSTSSEGSSTANLTQSDSVSQPGETSTDPDPLRSSSSVIASVSSSSVDDHKSTNLPITEIQTPHDVSSPPNPKEESKDEDQDEEPTKHETQQQEASVSSISREPEDAPLEAQPVGTDGGSTNAEHSQGSQESQASSSEKPTHQASTINVLSYSNLRDDTKVLLEQISAKNQGRTSKMSLASGDTKEDGADGNTQKDKQIPGYLLSRSKTWSARASPEERENLLKKMDSMRKEKRVYSRFEAS